ADFVRRHLPGITMTPPEGTYLAWLDCRSAGPAAADPFTFFLERAKVAFAVSTWTPGACPMENRFELLSSTFLVTTMFGRPSRE
ncbi:MAG: hypothetical protein V4760_02970, partial [Bdellovibrionota bacterium]